MTETNSVEGDMNCTMFASSTDDENGTAVKNELLPAVIQESDAGLRRSSRPSKKKTYSGDYLKIDKILFLL